LRHTVAYALSGATALVAGMHVAQAQPAESEQRADSALEEVVVTAQRRAANLQEVPVAVSALSAGDLKSAGVQTFSDLQALTPSLSISDGPAGRYLNIRGIGIGVGTPFQSAGVPLHLDGMYITRSEFFIRDGYFDLQSVEVYRGPQGTFAGQNSTGGAIFLTSNQPNFDGLSGSVQQTVGNYEWYQTQGFVNLPISDVWAARVAFNWERRDSFTESRGRGGAGVGAVPSLQETYDPGNLNRRSIRAILRYKPSDALDVRFRYDFVNDETDGDANLRAVQGSFDDPDALPSPRTINYDFPAYRKDTIHRGILNVKWQITDAVQFKSVTGHQALESLAGADADGTSPYVDYLPLTPGDQFAPQSWMVTRIRNDSFLQEFDLLSTGDGPLQWVVGAVGLAEHTPLFNTAGNYSVGNCTAAPSAANPNPAPCTSFDILTTTGAGPGNYLDYRQQHQSAAAFGEITYDLSDQFRVIAGGRYTYDKIELKHGSRAVSALPPNLPLTICGGSCADLFGVGEFKEPTGRLAFNWFPGGNKDTTVYATANRGFKPGGFQTALTLGQPVPGPQGHPPYQQEILNAYETGFKTVFFGGRLRSNLTGFFYDYQDWQASFRVPGQNIARSQNMPEVQAYGGELEIQAAFGDLRFGLNAGYTHSEVTKGPSAPLVIPGNTIANCVPIAAGCPGATNPLPLTFFDPVGLPLNYAPQWTYNASIEYDFHFGDSMLTPRLQYSFIDDQWVGLYHVSQDFLPGHSLLDFRLAYKTGENWRVEGFVTNVTDELYVSGVQAGPAATPYINSLALGAPRQVGVRIAYDF
jgi:iron complex outermembrane receptor protein